MRIASLLSLLLISITVGAQGILGRWATYDDETGRKRSIVEISERDGKVFGHIRQLFRDPGEDPDPTCTKCDTDDDRHNKRVIGMEIIRGLVRDGAEWADGTILDPKNGSVYDCKLWLEGGKLKVRGYVAFFYRTQTWVRE
ncbi:MAG: DUF2147 domain-containing protein [Flavobacteriales bacterium]